MIKMLYIYINSTFDLSSLLHNRT